MIECLCSLCCLFSEEETRRISEGVEVEGKKDRDEGIDASVHFLCRLAFCGAILMFYVFFSFIFF